MQNFLLFVKADLPSIRRSCFQCSVNKLQLSCLIAFRGREKKLLLIIRKRLSQQRLFTFSQ